MNSEFREQPLEDGLTKICGQLEKLGCTRSQVIFDNGVYTADVNRVPLITGWLIKNCWTLRSNWWHDSLGAIRLRVGTRPNSPYCEILVFYV